MSASSRSRSSEVARQGFLQFAQALLAPRGGHDASACSREQRGRFTADTARSSDHEDDLVFDCHGHMIHYDTSRPAGMSLVERNRCSADHGGGKRLRIGWGRSPATNPLGWCICFRVPVTCSPATHWPAVCGVVSCLARMTLMMGF